jgi:hypothetical protein
MTLVKNVNNPVVVNVFPAFSNLTAAGRTDGDFFSNRLVTIWTQFHESPARDKKVFGDRAPPDGRKGKEKTWFLGQVKAESSGPGFLFFIVRKG